MSTMAAGGKARRAPRHFTDEFKACAVRLLLDEGGTVGQVDTGAPGDSFNPHFEAVAKQIRLKPNLDFDRLKLAILPRG